jgi:hypothetical protein
VDRDFHFVMAAASYHLAHLSARAYSLLAIVAAEENFSPIEQDTRSVDAPRHQRAARSEWIIAFRLAAEDRRDHCGALPAAPRRARRRRCSRVTATTFSSRASISALTDGFFGAICDCSCSRWIAANVPLVDRAIAAASQTGLDICAELNLLPQWWVHRIAIHLLSDLWSNTFHEKIPLLPAGGDAADHGPASANSSSPARSTPKGRGRPVAVADRGGGARCRSDRQSRRFAADQRRQDPHRRIVHSAMFGRRASASCS